jgi:hypothetical protein
MCQDKGQAILGLRMGLLGMERGVWSKWITVVVFL